MESYLRKITETSHLLNEIGFPLDDDFIAVIMLSGLTEDYDPLVMAIENSYIKLSSEVVQSKLLQEFSCRDDSSGSALAVQKQPKCVRCKKTGHFIKDCPRKNKHNGNLKKVDKSKASKALLTALSANIESDSWYVDSSATSHIIMCCDRSVMYNFVKSKSLEVKAANGHKLYTEATSGDVTVASQEAVKCLVLNTAVEDGTYETEAEPVPGALSKQSEPSIQSESSVVKIDLSDDTTLENNQRESIISIDDSESSHSNSPEASDPADETYVPGSSDEDYDDTMESQSLYMVSTSIEEDTPQTVKEAFAGKDAKHWREAMTTPVPTSNMFADLETNEKEPKTTDQVTRQVVKPPPFFVDKVSNIQPLSNMLEEVAPDDYEIKICKGKKSKFRLRPPSHI
ncbi:hypothetical protein HF086_006396 [Spodoptera exigua]|uniref:CCHC-type domain-containing protein n=1 Tax=Spodoptera exigua TaxID=7107 RepID=A0A922MWS6_SPOEX|nr:hypothetical protein HF086_006396 [Spodoptera exigua]